MKIKVVIDDPLTEKLHNPLIKKNLDDLVKDTWKLIKKEMINKCPKNKTMEEDYNERITKNKIRRNKLLGKIR